MVSTAELGYYFLLRSLARPRTHDEPRVDGTCVTQRIHAPGRRALHPQMRINQQRLEMRLIGQLVHQCPRKRTHSNPRRPKCHPTRNLPLLDLPRLRILNRIRHTIRLNLLHPRIHHHINLIPRKLLLCVFGDLLAVRVEDMGATLDQGDACLGTEELGEIVEDVLV